MGNQKRDYTDPKFNVDDEEDAGPERRYDSDTRYRVLKELLSDLKRFDVQCRGEEEYMDVQKGKAIMDKIYEKLEGVSGAGKLRTKIGRFKHRCSTRPSIDSGKLVLLSVKSRNWLLDRIAKMSEEKK